MDHDPSMREALTNAPAAYDYAYTRRVVGRVEHERHGVLDAVTIPAEHFDYQTARYLSGMYVVITPVNRS